MLVLFAIVPFVDPHGIAEETRAENDEGMPNIVLMMTDDQGYQDLGCFGSEKIRTPAFDQMAREGTRFTDFYVAQAVCTASRAALMSGCYPNRIGLQGALNHTSRNGIHPDELLMPEICKSKGYATALYGKWHLGTVKEYLPHAHGFDEFFGIPYSNDNTKYHPVLADSMPPLPLYDGTEIIETDPDQSQFTRRCTQRAVKFIEQNRDRPFFLYMPHIMPHVPIFASEQFRGTSAAGLYGDVIEELDWSVGQVLQALKDQGVEDRTLVIFFSDNGPFLSYGDHAGSADPLREGKLTVFDGGVRSPCIMRWPGQIPAGRDCSEPVMSIDLLPTICDLLDAPLPEKTIDGRNILPILRAEQDAKSPHQALFFYAGQQLQAVRSGDWKLHFPHPYLTTAAEPGVNGKPSNWGKLKAKSITQSGIDGIASRHGYRVENLETVTLFNLRSDPGETVNVAADHPQQVERLSALAHPIRKALGDSLTGVVGEEVRPCAVLAD
ncbi:sulfatase family protein [Novipirellula artificiosorum]|uniref:sulfatase family protein n=1 Tax=Novipirellula artificiosorum TaxID=2528016 RepID=UPI001E3F34C1|nr:sulfatase [Novipirellula artificiosorum]